MLFPLLCRRQAERAVKLENVDKLQQPTGMKFRHSIATGRIQAGPWLFYHPLQ